MRKLLKRIFICALAACCFYCGSIFADRQKLDAIVNSYGYSKL